MQSDYVVNLSDSLDFSFSYGVLYPEAKNERGEIVNARDGDKKGIYFCLGCEERGVKKEEREMVLRRGKVYQPHFSHKNKGAGVSCEETVLHRKSKQIIKKNIEYCLASHLPYTVKWRCPNCYELHHTNLLTKVGKVEEEYCIEKRGTPGIPIPDIALLDHDLNLVIAIEVIVHHSPEDKALQYYNDNNIPVFSVVIKSESAYERLKKQPIEGRIGGDVLLVDLCSGCKEKSERLKRLADQQDIIKGDKDIIKTEEIRDEIRNEIRQLISFITREKRKKERIHELKTILGDIKKEWKEKTEKMIELFSDPLDLSKDFDSFKNGINLSDLIFFKNKLSVPFSDDIFDEWTEVFFRYKGDTSILYKGTLFSYSYTTKHGIKVYESDRKPGFTLEILCKKDEFGLPLFDFIYLNHPTFLRMANEKQD